jgi:hypothetical protein
MFNTECLHCRCIADMAKLLSTELYSKPSHFVLELVQNADDCSYPPHTQPKLLMVLFKGSSSSSSSSSAGGDGSSSSHVAGWFENEAFEGDGLLVASNEAGFSEANVRALCGMSASTKKRQAGAFTGEKGAWDAAGLCVTALRCVLFTITACLPPNALSSTFEADDASMPSLLHRIDQALAQLHGLSW